MRSISSDATDSWPRHAASIISSYPTAGLPIACAIARSSSRRTATSVSSPAAYHLIRRIFEEGFVAGDASVVDQVCSPDLVEHQLGLAGTGAQARENLKAAIRDVHQAVPDM